MLFRRILVTFFTLILAAIDLKAGSRPTEYILQGFLGWQLYFTFGVLQRAVYLAG